MAKSRRLLVALTGMCMSLAVMYGASISAEAGSGNNYLGNYSGGASAILDPGATNTTEVVSATAEEWNLDLSQIQVEERSNLVMADVSNALNVRLEPNADSEKVGKLYKDCGGIVLERRDGWTKIQSGELIGWASDEYLIFGEDAEALAAKVGRTIAHVNDGLNVRKEPGTDAEVYGVVPAGGRLEVIFVGEDGWACVDYEGRDGYVSMDFITIEFQIDEGETMAQIEAREAAEYEARRYVDYGEFTVDEETLMLLAALIHCEARGESYEGQVAVGAVVLNRVRSSAYPDTISGVIYASGQFSPAQSGKLDRVIASGNINDSCIEAAKEVLSGYSNVGDMTHFRRNDGRDGLVIGNHVFY